MCIYFNTVDANLTLRLMAKKNTKLKDVLMKLRECRSDYLGDASYVFKAYDDNFKRAKSTCDRNENNDFEELFEYKTMSNVTTFDMNTEVRNLSTFDLELVEKIQNKSRDRKLEPFFRSMTIPGPYTEVVDPIEDSNEEEKYTRRYSFCGKAETGYEVLLVEY